MEMVNLTLDQDEIRFTPEGKIAVIDAIEALTGSRDGRVVWRNMVDGNPELNAWCDVYHFPQSDSTPVLGLQGWEKVEALLFDYIVGLDIDAARKDAGRGPRSKRGGRHRRG